MFASLQHNSNSLTKNWTWLMIICFHLRHSQNIKWKKFCNWTSRFSLGASYHTNKHLCPHLSPWPRVKVKHKGITKIKACVRWSQSIGQVPIMPFSDGFIPCKSLEIFFVLKYPQREGTTIYIHCLGGKALWKLKGLYKKWKAHARKHNACHWHGRNLMQSNVVSQYNDKNLLGFYV